MERYVRYRPSVIASRRSLAACPRTSRAWRSLPRKEKSLRVLDVFAVQLNCGNIRWSCTCATEQVSSRAAVLWRRALALRGRGDLYPERKKSLRVLGAFAVQRQVFSPLRSKERQESKSTNTWHSGAFDETNRPPPLRVLGAFAVQLNCRNIRRGRALTWRPLRLTPRPQQKRRAPCGTRLCLSLSNLIPSASRPPNDPG